MKIYTKTGDQGQTRLYSGEAVSKNDPRVQLLSCLDELTSHIGFVKASLSFQQIFNELEDVQRALIKVMGVIASTSPQSFEITEQDVNKLEERIDYYQSLVPKWSGFVLPGQNKLSASIDIARTVARRAETILAVCPCPPEISSYVNRLSDYLYSLARYADEVYKPTIVNQSLELSSANQIIRRTLDYARFKGVQAVVCVAGREGNPISVQVMDDAFVVSFELALKKAFTSAALKLPTHELGMLTAPQKEFEGLEEMLSGKIITLGGGYPIHSGEGVVGAIGVSGGTVEADIDIARYGANCLE